MILITGGLGFIGLHTARALVAQGETCVLTQHRTTSIPEILKEEIGSRLSIEQLDVTDTNVFLKLGEKHPITGIIHLAVSWTRTPGPRVPELFKDIQANMIGLVNVLEAAQAWKVKRILVAGTLSVYGDESAVPWREDQPLSLTASEFVSAFKKCNTRISLGSIRTRATARSSQQIKRSPIMSPGSGPATSIRLDGLRCPC